MIPVRLALPAVLAAVALPVSAGDWPQWGGRDARNMVSGETGLPATFEPGEKLPAGSAVDPATARDLRWAARLGTETYGTPAVAGGRVFVGTNNGRPRDARCGGDRGVLLCFDEKTGAFLWQLVAPKLREEGSFNGDFPNLGLCSSPTVAGDRVYVVTSCCEVLCLDVDGLADGNDGPFVDEGRYLASPKVWKQGRRPPGTKLPDGPPPEAIPLDSKGADIVWRYDMIAELDAWPQDASDCSVLVRGGLVYAGTSNGVDRSHTNIPSPKAPSLIALDAATGRLVAADDADIGPRILHGQWSSPSLATIRGRPLLLYGGGDGFLHAFDPEPADRPGSPVKVLRSAWKCDCNPPDYRIRDGKRLPYNKNAEGPSEVIGTPVAAEDRVYVTIGQDSRHGPGKGALTCIDPQGSGDLSATARAWTYTGINRSFSTPSVAGGLVFAADWPGTVHCLDARTGAPLWTHDTKGKMMGSTLVADGKVYAENEAGKLVVLAASREKKVLGEVRLRSPFDCAPVAANRVLYLATHAWLYAAAGK